MKTWRDFLSAALQANNENWTYINARTFIDGECDIPVTEPFRFVVWTARFVYVNNAEGGPEPVRVIPRNPPIVEDEPSIWDGCEKPGAHQAATEPIPYAEITETLNGILEWDRSKAELIAYAEGFEEGARHYGNGWTEIILLDGSDDERLRMMRDSDSAFDVGDREAFEQIAKAYHTKYGRALFVDREEPE